MLEIYFSTSVIVNCLYPIPFRLQVDDLECTVVLLLVTWGTESLHTALLRQSSLEVKQSCTFPSQGSAEVPLSEQVGFLGHL